MTLPLTPDMLAACYDFLCTTPPFNKWNLPDSEDVVFRVGRDPKLLGWYKLDDGRHVIGISETTIGHTFSLVMVMAHEMLHLHQKDTRIETRAQHNAAFRKLARVVCRFHGFDPKLF